MVLCHSHPLSAPDSPSFNYHSRGSTQWSGSGYLKKENASWKLGKAQMERSLESHDQALSHNDANPSLQLTCYGLRLPFLAEFKR